MIDRIESLKSYIRDGKHHVYRRTSRELGLDKLAENFAEKRLPDVLRSSECLAELLDKEVPVILPGERIVFTRTVADVPAVFTAEEWDAITKNHYIHEKGYVCNISADYGKTLRLGLEARRKEISERLGDETLTREQKDFLKAAGDSVAALQAFILKYAAHAASVGETETAKVLETISKEGAHGLREALQLLRAMRAYYYWMICDNFGDAPLVVDKSTELPEKTPRKDIYDFIVSELKEVIPSLDETQGGKMYGRMNKWAGMTLLANVYLNAEVYTGTAHWQDCLDVCDEIITKSPFALSENYNASFRASGTENSPEIIFALVFDKKMAGGQSMHMHSWHGELQKKFKLEATPWGSGSTMGVTQFIDTYDEDDTRLEDTWLMGDQYTADGEPIYCVYDHDPKDKYILSYHKEVKDGHYTAEDDGYRMFKFEVAEGTTGDSDTDFPMHRYSEVLLMKAECLLRLGQPGAGELVTQVRRRAFKDNPSKAVVSDDDKRFLVMNREVSGKDKMGWAYLGPSYTGRDVENLILRRNASARYLPENEMNEVVSGLLAEGAVVGWFKGRMEFGPRALGNRSILANPRDEDTQRKLNMEIKRRESFRPFAPSVLEEESGEYFEWPGSSPYMLFVDHVVRERRKSLPEDYRDMSYMEKLRTSHSVLPAVTHVDFSARVQTVSKEANPSFHGLLEAFKRKTGFGVLVNTSFNVRGEPIVCSPDNAFDCFMNTGMDYLVIENYLFSKTDSKNEQ